MPIRHSLDDVFREGQVFTAKGVIAEQSGAEAIEIAIFRRGIVDRITRII